MEVYHTEEEQLEAIKRFFGRYGKTLIIAAIAVGACVLGWRYWQHHTSVMMERASMVYEEFLLSLSKKDTVSLNTHGDQLRTEYARTPYAAMAALVLAKEAIRSEDLDKAHQYLEWALKAPNSGWIRPIVVARLARIKLELNKVDEALALLPKDTAGAYQTLFEEIKGDVWLKKGDTLKAKEAYALAISAAPEGVLTTRIQMKREDLGENS